MPIKITFSHQACIHSFLKQILNRNILRPNRRWALVTWFFFQEIINNFTCMEQHFRTLQDCCWTSRSRIASCWLPGYFPDYSRHRSLSSLPGLPRRISCIPSYTHRADDCQFVFKWAETFQLFRPLEFFLPILLSAPCPLIQKKISPEFRPRGNLKLWISKRDGDLVQRGAWYSSRDTRPL